MKGSELDPSTGASGSPRPADGGRRRDRTEKQAGATSDYAQWLQRGLRHQEARRLIDAMICYRRALRSNPGGVEARCSLGEVLHELGRQDEARAEWRAGLKLSPESSPLLLRLARAASVAGEHGEALEAYRRVRDTNPRHRGAALGLAASQVAEGDEEGYVVLREQLGDAAPFQLWNELSRTLAAARPSAQRTALLLQIAATRADEMPPLMLAQAAEEMIAVGRAESAREMLARLEEPARSIDDPETLRRLALVAAATGSSREWPERYGKRCLELAAGSMPLLWPRRTAGAAVRVVYLVGANRSLHIDGVAIDLEAYLREIVAAHPRDRVVAKIFVIGEPQFDAAAVSAADVPVVTLGSSPDAALARAVAAVDADALIDLAGLGAAIGPLLAQRPARTLWTYAGLAKANTSPLITHWLPPLRSADAQMLAQHRLELEYALLEACASAPWFSDVGRRTAPALEGDWRAAVAAHRRGDREAALAGYRDVLAEQPSYAAGQYLLGSLLRDGGQPAEAGQALSAAVKAAPAYADARVALAGLMRDGGLAAQAVALCEEGVRQAPNDPALWRELGLSRLAQHDGRAARWALWRALKLEPMHAMTHYNHGVASQMLGKRGRALGSYQRALELDPGLVAADFNIGIIYREQGRMARAISAFERVLARDPQNDKAHKALCDTLLGERRLDAWLLAFDRFEAACPNAFSLLIVALEACQYRADFARLEHYLARLAGDDFRPSSETDLADCLEELLHLLLYFDVEPKMLFELYKAYDLVASRVHGVPIALPADRRPGRIRVGYLSGDLRNHVMGKMMWPAVERHDRSRFELFFYSLSSASDAWTERYRSLADHFEVIADLHEGDAAERIAKDDLDILVDLATHTHGSKPGILARKPARVQITHVASAGAVGLSAIDFKLTDASADVPESQAFQLERLLPMAGCVYPFRQVQPAPDHPFLRDRMGIAPDAVVIGAFVNPLKLSRRCLALWREVLERIPRAILAISPMSPERSVIYERLFASVGIVPARVAVVPQGRDDAENQARYSLIDFVLDPLPYGGVNGTIEALAMGVPVVTLVGRAHAERSGYSILTNLGVAHTIATSGREYVDIAVRLATDPAFGAKVRAAIHAGLQRSPLTDMDAHTRNLEQAYVEALRQRFPAALPAADNG